MASKSQFLQWIQYRIRVTIQDGRMFVGTFLAFDKHLNVVLSETEEFRTVKSKKTGESGQQYKRSLGLVIIRGENIVSMNAEALPTQNQGKQVDTSGTGVGKATAITRTGPGGLPSGPSNISGLLGMPQQLNQ